MGIKEFSCPPGEGVSNVEKAVRPLCIELARRVREFRIGDADKQWFTMLIQCALEGNIPRFTGWHKDMVDWAATEAEFGLQAKPVVDAQS